MFIPYCYQLTWQWREGAQKRSGSGKNAGDSVASATVIISNMSWKMKVKLRDVFADAVLSLLVSSSGKSNRKPVWNIWHLSLKILLKSKKISIYQNLTEMDRNFHFVIITEHQYSEYFCGGRKSINSIKWKQSHTFLVPSYNIIRSLRNDDLRV